MISPKSAYSTRTSNTELEPSPRLHDSLVFPSSTSSNNNNNNNNNSNSNTTDTGRSYYDVDTQRSIETTASTQQQQQNVPLSQAQEVFDDNAVNPTTISTRAATTTLEPIPIPPPEQQRQQQQRSVQQQIAFLESNTNVGFKEQTDAHLNVTLFALTYNLKNAKKSPCLCCVGVSAILFVVLGIAIAGSVMENLKTVFFRMTELSNGENDFVIRPENSLMFDSLNYTLVDSALKRSLGDPYSYTTPRLKISSVRLYSNADCTQDVLEASKSTENRSRIYDNSHNSLCHSASDFSSDMSLPCTSQLCEPNIQAPTVPLYAIDSTREKRMGLGRDFEYTLAQGQALVDSTTHVQMGLVYNSTIWVEMTTSFLMSSYCASIRGATFKASGTLSNSTVVQNLLDTYPMVTFPLQVIGSIGHGNGKFRSDVSELVLVDYASFFQHIVQYQHPALDVINEACGWNNLDMNDFATQVILNLPPDRVSYYKDLDFDSLLATLVKYITPAAQLIGFSQIRVKMPLVEDMLLFQYLTMFLGLIINIVIALFVVLSVILIYSLLMITIHQRSFEHGVFRMLGLSRIGIVILVMMQTLLYAVPGVVIGLIISAAIFAFIVAPLFEAQSGLQVSRRMPEAVVSQAIIIALVIPVISAVIPIQHVITQTLRAVLDVRRSKSDAVKYTVTRAVASRVPLWTMTGGAVFFVFGLMIYYLLPKSLLSEDLATLLGIFFAIILAMLLGLTVLVTNFETALQKIVLMILLGWWEKLSIVRIVGKNLAIHRANNRKTTLMFATSLSFVIFLTSILQLQNKSSSYRVLATNGAYLTVSSAGGMSSYTCEQIEQVLVDSTVSQLIESHSWITLNIGDIVGDGLYDKKFTHLGRSFKLSLNLVGVSPNFMDVVVPGFFKMHTLRVGELSNTSPSELLYTAAGSQSAWMAAMLTNSLGIGLGGIGVLDFKYDERRYSTPQADTLTVTGLADSNIVAVSSGELVSGQNTTLRTFTHYPLLALTLVTQSAGVSLMEKPSSTFDTVVSIPTFQKILKTVVNDSSRFRDAVDHTNQIPMFSVLIRVVANASSDDKDLIIARLREVSGGADIFDYRSVEKAVATFQSVITISGAFITAVVLCLSFFSLVSSMFSNILSQSKEIGVLLALGMPKNQVIRVYIHEAFVLVFSASMLGLFTGTVVAITMSLQQAVMSSIPIPFYFPAELVIVIFVVGWILAVLAAYFPARDMVSKNVVQILNRLD